MSKKDYNSQAELLVKVIDIAIDCFNNTPPEGWEENHIKQFVNVYLGYKNDVTNPEPRFHNIRSLNQTMDHVLTYFQEGTGKAIDGFWKEINIKKLDIKRVNRFERILKRGKIKNHIEYDVIIDLYNSYIETNMLPKQDVDKINDLILNFEKANS